MNGTYGEPAADICRGAGVHDAMIRRVSARLPDDGILYDMAELFKVFGDFTRIKIICALFESEMCVRCIAGVLGMSQSAVSHQLRTLKAMRLVNYRREGKTVIYSLADDHIRTIFDQGYEHATER